MLGLAMPPTGYAVANSITPGPGEFAMAQKPVAIRSASQPDNWALCRLASDAPMRAAVSIAVDRTPDFFALNALLGDPWEVLLATSDHRVVGCVAWGLRSAMINGRPVRAGYCGDLKVHPESQGRGIATMLCLAAREAMARHQQDMPVLLTTIAGNRVVERMAQSDRAGPLYSLSTIALAAVPFVQPRRIPADGGARCGPARERDRDEMVDLWNAAAVARQFNPIHSAESLMADMERAPGLELESCLVVRDRRDRLVAWGAFWDQTALKRVRVLRYTNGMRAARLVLNGLASLMGSGPLPAPGGVLRVLNAYQLCARDSGDLALLLRQAYHRYRSAGYSHISVALDRRDPWRAALNQFWTLDTDLRAYLTTPNRDAPPAQLDARPVRFEPALV